MGRRGATQEDAQGVPQAAREEGGRHVTLGSKFSKKKT